MDTPVAVTCFKAVLLEVFLIYGVWQSSNFYKHSKNKCSQYHYRDCLTSPLLSSDMQMFTIMVLMIQNVIQHETGVIVPAGEPAGCGRKPPGAGGAVRAPAGAGRAPGAVAQHLPARHCHLCAERRARAGGQLRARRRQAALHCAALQFRAQALFFGCCELDLSTYKCFMLRSKN